MDAALVAEHAAKGIHSFLRCSIAVVWRVNLQHPEGAKDVHNFGARRSPRAAIGSISYSDSIAVCHHPTIFFLAAALSRRNVIDIIEAVLQRARGVQDFPFFVGRENPINRSLKNSAGKHARRL